MKCKYCGKEIINKGSLISHEMCCKSNPDKIKHKRGAGGWPKGRPTWNKGLTKETSEIMKKKGDDLHQRYVAGELHGTFRGKTHSPEAREKISEAIKKRYEKGWMPKAGRCEKIDYNSPIAGLIKVDGTWELAVAQYLDQQQLRWTRNTKKFDYVDDSGNKRKYTPDFYVESWGAYLEIKGYETDLDRAKWRNFPEKLVVWKKKELKENGVLR